MTHRMGYRIESPYLRKAVYGGFKTKAAIFYSTALRISNTWALKGGTDYLKAANLGHAGNWWNGLRPPQIGKHFKVKCHHVPLVIPTTTTT